MHQSLDIFAIMVVLFSNSDFFLMGKLFLRAIMQGIVAKQILVVSTKAKSSNFLFK